VRQLIARIDDALHARVKDCAHSEGVSMNSFVTRALQAAVTSGDARAELRNRLREAGYLAELRVSPAAPTREDVIAQLRGASDVVLEALEGSRAPR
jgi:hypothetical protein